MLIQNIKISSKDKTAGKPTNGIAEDDNLYYKNGELFSGTAKGVKYKKGVAQSKKVKA